MAERRDFRLPEDFIRAQLAPTLRRPRKKLFGIFPPAEAQAFVSRDLFWLEAGYTRIDQIDLERNVTRALRDSNRQGYAIRTLAGVEEVLERGGKFNLTDRHLDRLRGAIDDYRRQYPKDKTP